jgi:diguanylate cyclase (GGDEF)-like protein
MRGGQKSAEERDSALLHAQLIENASSVRASLLGNLFNALICAALLVGYAAAPGKLIVAGGLGLLATIIWRLNTMRRIEATTADAPDLRLLARHVDANAAMLGALWGIVSFGLFATGHPDIQMFAGIIGAGMISAGAIAFRSRKRAALLYVGLSGLGGVCALLLVDGLAADLALGLLCCFMMVLAVNIRATSVRFDESQLRLRELARSTETIQLLLNDFAEQGSDWMIEVDRMGRIINPVPRLGEATGRDLDVLANMTFSHLLDDNAARQELEHMFIGKEIVHRHICSLTVGEETRWWSINGRPSRDPEIAYRGVVTDITAQRDAENRVTYLAHYDSLTGLPNRVMFNEGLERALNDDDALAGVIYIDLDQFKGINDTLGHPVGDELLHAAAQRIAKAVGKSALVSRLGGDEFAVLVHARRLPMIDRIAAQIIEALSRPIALKHHDICIGASAGIALAPDHSQSPEGLMRRADLALYAAKAAGRGRFEIFDPSMDEAAQTRRTLELDLRKAISDNQFCLHYQPVIHVESGRISGYEALIRWNHPERGLLSPDLFIPIAEDNGLITRIGEWVIRQALEDAGRWTDGERIAVNLSAAQIQSPTLLPTIINALASSGVAAERLCLEITETLFLRDTDKNLDVLHRIRALGIQIALDDFGTGYSSLNYLRSFPFDVIKIDRCFVNELETSTDCQAIIRSVVSLAESLDIKIVAEGVERIEQVNALAAHGCGEVQGFYYSEAVPACDIVSPNGEAEMGLAA